jgi:hypothetical protein
MLKVLRLTTTRHLESSFSTSAAGSQLCSTDYGPSDIRAIIFPEPEQLRSRRVVSRSNSRSAGKYPSWKMKRMLHWESAHELNAFRLLDCDPDVTKFGEQPCELEFVMDGVERVHYPDILVTTTAGEEFWGVKPQSNALEPEVLARTELLSLALPRWGYVYRMVFAQDLARQPRLNNANLLLHFGARGVGDGEWEEIRRVVQQRGRLIWSEACCGDYGTKGCETLCGLVLRGILAIDMNSPVTPDTHFLARKEL